VHEIIFQQTKNYNKTLIKQVYHYLDKYILLK